MPAGIVSASFFVPGEVVGNAQISRWANTDEKWIADRTGIAERRYAPAGMTTSDMAVRASKPLVAESRTAENIGIILVATTTPDQPQPATASFVQRDLGLHAVPAFDVNAVCSGFLYALTVAESLIATRYAGLSALVVGADKYSTIMDRGDRRTVSLFGDGAGAVLVKEVPDGYGIHGSSMVADGRAADFVRVEAGGTRRPLTPEAWDKGGQYFRMDGRAVKEWALQFVPKVVNEAVEQADWDVEDIDHVVFHQGNVRLVEALGADLGIDASKLVLTAPYFGNTAAASIPLTLARENSVRPFQRGERILLAAVGGGMTAAATALTWY